MNGSIEGGARRRRPDPGAPATVLRRDAGPAESAAAARAWWDHDADRYLAEHGADLGDVRLQWGPEGLDEDTAGLLGDVRGRRALELGCGAGHGARWAASRGAVAVGVDISHRMLEHAQRLDDVTGVNVRWVQADARRLPLADGCVDVAFSAYGALPFLPRLADVFAEVARVVRPGGLWVFSLTHPFRWCFRDDPGADGLVVERSYFDRRAYVEEGPDGRATYTEHHHTLADVVGDLLGSGFVLRGLLEPEWPQGRTAGWGPWSPERGALLPGTLVVAASRA